MADVTAHRLTDQGARMILKAILVAFELDRTLSAPFFDAEAEEEADKAAGRPSAINTHWVTVSPDVLRISEKDERELMVSRTDTGWLHLSLRRSGSSQI